jgi:hypothetical protein
MNTQPALGAGAHEATRGGGRGRGRGDGRGGSRAPVAPKAIAAKAAKSKVGPTRLLETEWVKDSLLKEDCFIIWLGSGKAGDQQWTVHRAIGETSLPDGSWVMTPSRDLGFLLARRESEELSAWKRRAELAKRQMVLRARTGRRTQGDDETEVWSFDGSPAIQPTIRTCMAAAKAAGAQESAWLDYADNAVQVAERSFKEALRTQGIPVGWIRANPKPDHQTMGGPLGDIPQKSVPYLEGLGINAAKDKVLRVILGIDSNVEPEEDEEDENPNQPGVAAAKAVATPASPPRNGAGAAS